MQITFNARNIIISMRPRQWIKNLFIFPGLVFSGNLFQMEPLVKVTFGFFIFSLAASSIYILNDIMDIDSDRRHPKKSQRPIASGKLSIKFAIVYSVIIALTALITAFGLDQTFFYIISIYVIMNLAYSTKIKQLVILDVMTIALGFALRVVAGTTLAVATASNWLILCTLFISLFLALGKRRQELVFIEPTTKGSRKVLEIYSKAFLDQMISVATACTIITYALYTLSADTIQRFGSRELVITVPFVIYGIFRYLYLIYYKETGENPTNSVLTDAPLLINCFLWIIGIIFIVYS